jgi:hypothetical protein
VSRLALVLGAFFLLFAWPVSRAGAAGVAVVELFTSEGCSSCPPADDLLIEIARQARQDKRAIYPLSFHVDYWDDLGWKDPFGSAANSKRQSDYVAAFGGEGPYTPEMVVNGRSGFVGSRRDQAQREIARALEQPTTADVRIISAAQMPDGSVTVLAHIRGADARDRAVIALAERAVEHHIGAGENSGRTLHHGEVVRALQTTSVGKEGDLKITLAKPAGPTPGKSSIVVFVQNARTLAVTGASRIDL